MNRPGEVGGNWSWQLERDQLTEALAARLRRATALGGRLPAAAGSR
jgi:4-alpha-glucanotransferase